MKSIIIFMVITFILPLPAKAYSTQLKYVANLKKECDKGGGMWHEFNNNCADICSAKLQKLICARANLRFSCDCIGTNECWNDKINKCQSFQEYQPFYKEYLKRSKVAVEKIRKKIVSKIKKSQEVENSIVKPINPGETLDKSKVEKDKPQVRPQVKNRFINAN